MYTVQWCYQVIKEMNNNYILSRFKSCWYPPASDVSYFQVLKSLFQVWYQFKSIDPHMHQYKVRFSVVVNVHQSWCGDYWQELGWAASGNCTMLCNFSLFLSFNLFLFVVVVVYWGESVEGMSICRLHPAPDCWAPQAQFTSMYLEQNT